MYIFTILSGPSLGSLGQNWTHGGSSDSGTEFELEIFSDSRHLATVRNPDVAGVHNEHDLNMLTRGRIAASRNPSFPLRKTANVSVGVAG
jgi:hypothetical protein